jgi:ABC-type polysaccharide/polyol phosphate transport system ATPase subunit
VNEVAIHIDSLSKSYYLNNKQDTSITKTVFENLTLTINKGERWGIIGKNGSGKSTLLKILSGIVKPTSGSATLYGTVAHILSVGDNFIPDLTGKENADIFLRINGFSKKQSADAWDKIAAFAEIGNYVSAPVKTYSNGMYLRLAFAACLQLSANILLVDEIFSAGDAAFQEKLQKHFKSIFSYTETMVMVSHNPEEIISYCTHCLWLDAGAVKMIGTAKDVEAAYYYELTAENWERDYNRPLLQEVTIPKMSFVPVENEYLKVLDFGITARKGYNAINYENGIRFYIDIDKKQPGIILHPAIKIYDYLMNLVLMLLPQANSKDDDKMKQHKDRTGIMHFETTLQPNILTFGNYYAELVFSKNVTKESDFLEEAIKVTSRMHFIVEQGEIYDYAGGTDNVFVKPKCEWEVFIGK